MDTKHLFESLDAYIAMHEDFVNACKTGNLEYAKELFETSKIDEDYDAGKALRWAAIKKQYDTVVWLLRTCDIDHTLDEHKATHWAAAGGDIQTLEFIISCGGDPTYDNSCSLYFAAENGHLDVVKLLVEKYNCDITVFDYCAERFARNNGFHDVADYLQKMR